MDRDAAWRVIHQERARLADLLADLTADEWEQPSLCAGWSVRHVAAHVISSPQATPWSLVSAMTRARGNFNRCIDEQARAWAARPTEVIVEDYRRLDGSRRHPLGTTYRDPLLDVLVHSQDIAVPLNKELTMPIAAACAAADYVWRRGFPFRARRRLTGFRLTATDAAWSVGQGETVAGPVASLLLLLTGRTVAVAQLAGAGSDALAQRLTRAG
jgi:uncharacterized protein (TIGR03083 family)